MMATITFVKYKKQSAGTMDRTTKYVSQFQKTTQEDGCQLISGQNCTPQLAAQEFLTTRQMHHKDSPVWFYHYVQSFSPNEKISGALAHELVCEFAEQAWPDSEILIATHTDADHIHTHFIVNAVCYRTGKMLRQGPNTLKRLRSLSDKFCSKHGLSVLPKPQTKRANGMNSREYRSAVKGESWKFRLMNTIDQCMRYAFTREEFIALMESEGYQVHWVESRKSITYTTPKGMKCRDDRLHDMKYRKEKMVHEFRIRAEMLLGGTQEEKYGASNPTGDASNTAGMDADAGTAGKAGAAHSRSDSPSADTLRHGGDVPHPGADGGTVAGCGPDTGDAATGWETEREMLFSSQTPPAAHSLARPAFRADSPSGEWGRAVGSVVQLGKALESASPDPGVTDTTNTHPHADQKLLKKERQKKIALGHKEDDHEDEQNWRQTM